MSPEVVPPCGFPRSPHERRGVDIKGLICYTKEAGLYAVNKKSIKHVK